MGLICLSSAIRVSEQFNLYLKLTIYISVCPPKRQELIGWVPSMLSPFPLGKGVSLHRDCYLLSY